MFLRSIVLFHFTLLLDAQLSIVGISWIILSDLNVDIEPCFESLTKTELT